MKKSSGSSTSPAGFFAEPGLAPGRADPGSGGSVLRFGLRAQAGSGLPARAPAFLVAALTLATSPRARAAATARRSLRKQRRLRRGRPPTFRATATRPARLPGGTTTAVFP